MFLRRGVWRRSIVRPPGRERWVDGVVETLESLRRALGELEGEKEKAEVKAESVEKAERKIERSAIPRRQVAVSSKVG